MFNRARFDEKKFKGYMDEMSEAELEAAYESFWKLHVCLMLGYAGNIVEHAVLLAKTEVAHRKILKKQVNEIIDNRKAKK